MEDEDTIRRVLMGCSLTAALEVVGERWSFLILRGAFNGLGHFEQFQSALGIARNILANRLSRLVENGLMQRLPCADDRRKVEYRLTDKGAALLPAVVALRQWGERWASVGRARAIRGWSIRATVCRSATSRCARRTAAGSRWTTCAGS